MARTMDKHSIKGGAPFMTFNQSSELLFKKAWLVGIHSAEALEGKCQFEMLHYLHHVHVCSSSTRLDVSLRLQYLISRVQNFSTLLVNFSSNPVVFSVLQLPAIQLHAKDVHFMQD